MGGGHFWKSFDMQWVDTDYDNTGCGVFKWGVQIRKIFAYESTYSKEIIEFWELG